MIIFGFTFLLSAIFSNKKISQLKEIQDRIAIDILSTETRYSLLEKTSCDHVVRGEDDEFGLSQELNTLARKLKHMESQLGPNDTDVLFVKQYYTLLQIKDFLLMQELDDRCDHDLFTILYFHEGGCKDCQRQSLTLDEIVDEYPGTRVYWLDLDTPSPAMSTLVSLFEVTEGPTMVIDGEAFKGFVSYDDIEELLPESLKAFQFEGPESESDKENNTDDSDLEGIENDSE